MLQQNRWSSLPDDIIAKIISHLDVIPRGSTITISTTNFDVKLYKRDTNNISEFWSILDNLFTIFTTPCIENFSIDLDHTLYDEPCVRPILYSWARRLRACSIKHIAIQSLARCHFGDRVCPPSVFQIHSLVSLRLSSLFINNEYDRFVSLPIILPNLEDLSIGYVKYGLLGRLLSSCPSLTRLCFSLVVEPKDEIFSVSISSKSLKRLNIFLDMLSVREDIDVIIDAPILEHLYFSANNSSFLSMRTFNSISNLKSLTLGGGLATKLFNSPTKIIFPNLTYLALFSVNSSLIFNATLKQQILHCPKIEVLLLHFSVLCKIVWDTKAILLVPIEHVKHLTLDMTILRINRQTLNFVTWLLRSAPVLKKLVIRGYGTRPSDDSLSEFCKTLLKCAEDTSRCQIDFLGGYKLD
ncbi:F-box protein At4g09920-like [Silene latifolia]|uniref:F-box protein At4g09920-like n=1 Tax=Silene latifolia TaxID=37657 RepID=UPI003D787179